MKRLRTWLPHRIRGRYKISVNGWQIIGGKRWSLVVFTRIERTDND